MYFKVTATSLENYSKCFEFKIAEKKLSAIWL